MSDHDIRQIGITTWQCLTCTTRPTFRGLEAANAHEQVGSPCNCEHHEHFAEHPLTERLDHEYMAVPAGRHIARYVGEICDSCAMGHLSQYVIR